MKHKKIEIVKRYPVFKEAVDKFERDGFGHGEVVPTSWFYETFGIKQPNDDTPHGAAKRTQFEFLSAFKAFEEVLLVAKHMALDTVRGCGYRVVEAAEQTAWAEKKGKDEMKNVIRRMYRREVNVNLSLLTPEQRQENANALARLTMLDGMTKKLSDLR